MVKRSASLLCVVCLGFSAVSPALNDPTRPTDHALFFGTGQSASSAQWVLQSILLSSDRRIAVINGTRVREGDRLGSAKVVRIADSHVLLKTGGTTLTLRLLPETVKVRP
jgi:MSHA biogenesis protein MshK